jgi:cytoskeleton protein RodZ
MNQEMDNVEIEPVGSYSVGLLLKEAREAKQLSLLDVAAELRLTRDTVANIEEQQWDKLHGRAYARGYFLNYVKFMQLDENEMLRNFNQQYKRDEPELVLSKKGELSQTKKTLPWTGIIFVVLALVLTGVAYKQWQMTQNAETQVNNDQTTEDNNQIFDDFGSNGFEPLDEK